MVAGYPIIKLENFNNKLYCNGFVVINFPPATKFSTKVALKVFQLNVGNKVQYVSIVNVIETPFKDIGDWYSIPAFGLREGEFRRMWMQKHPTTTDETILAIYFYQKIN